MKNNQNKCQPMSTDNETTQTKITMLFKVEENKNLVLENVASFRTDRNINYYDDEYKAELPQGEKPQSIVKLNKLGMVMIPKAIRIKLGIASEQPVTILKDDDAVILLKGDNVYGYDDCEKWVRHIDELGRVALPFQIRQALGIKEDQEFSMYCNDDEEMVIEKLWSLD